MTFAGRETSRTLGAPIALFRFGWGDRLLGYTTSEYPITLDGEDLTYQPIPIERNAITSSGNMDKSTLQIRLPVNTEIVDLFRVYPPSEVVGVTIFQGHQGEDEFLAIFVGRVLSSARKGRIASLNCEPAITSMRRPGLRRRFQYACPHVLYGSQCRANRADFTIERQVLSVSGANVTMSPGWQGQWQPTNFQNGLFEWQGPNGTELRNILKADGDILLLSGRLSSLVPGSTVNLSLGCKHNMDDCLGVFNNIHNYGGQPWIPVKNPIGFVNQYY